MPQEDNLDSSDVQAIRWLLECETPAGSKIENSSYVYTNDSDQVDAGCFTVRLRVVPPTSLRDVLDAYTARKRSLQSDKRKLNNVLEIFSKIYNDFEELVELDPAVEEILKNKRERVRALLTELWLSKEG